MTTQIADVAEDWFTVQLPLGCEEFLSPCTASSYGVNQMLQRSIFCEAPPKRNLKSVKPYGEYGVVIESFAPVEDDGARTT